jgi:hypothetical protein
MAIRDPGSSWRLPPGQIGESFRPRGPGALTRCETDARSTPCTKISGLSLPRACEVTCQMLSSQGRLCNIIAYRRSLCVATPPSRSGSDLRHHRHTPIARHGHPGQAYCISLALAEWLCRTADRIDPARVCGPFRRLGRGASAPNPASLCSLLQRHQNAPVIG